MTDEEAFKSLKWVDTTPLCMHQYFEIKKLHKRFGDDKLRHKDGVLVKCALCNLSKELWE